MHRLCKSCDETRPSRQDSGLAGRPLAIVLLICIVFAGAVLGDARAAETRIRTLLLAPLPEATTIEIHPPVEDGSDDLRLAVALADHFSILLTALGYTTVEVDGELLFRFAAEEPTYAQGDGPYHHGGLAAGWKQADGLPGESYSVKLASLAAVSESDEDTYRLRVSVARIGKPPLWTGYIERSLRGAERKAAYFKMADALLAYWGKTHADSQ